MGVNLHFYIKGSDTETPTSIYVRFKKRGKRFVWSLGRDRAIPPELWDDERQRPATTRGHKDLFSKVRVKRLIEKYEAMNPHLKAELENINSRIENVSSEIRAYLSAKEHQNDTIDYDELKDLLYAKYTPHRSSTVTEKEGSLLQFVTDYYQHFVEGIKSGDILKDSGKGHGQRYAYETIRTYQNTLDHWKGFETALKRRIRWKDVNLELYDRLINHCNGNGNSANYIGKIIKNLKSIMKRAYDTGHHENEEFRRSYFKVLKVDVDKIALTEEELERIRTVDLTGMPLSYDLYRDVFLIGCYTALRFSDFSRIRPEHVKGDLLHIITRKTNRKVIIPIRHELKSILAKYDNRIPSTARQHVNKAIKQIGKVARITEPIEYQKVKGGETVLGTKPKYAMIETHTARRTGATLMYLATKDPIACMKITGHTTAKNFMNYIKIDEEQNAKILASSSFFKGQLKLVR